MSRAENIRFEFLLEAQSVWPTLHCTRPYRDFYVYEASDQWQNIFI